MKAIMMDKILIIICNYFHDLAVAVLAVNVIAIYYIGRFLDNNPIRDKIIPMLFKRLKVVTYYALGYIIVGGFIRAIYFEEIEWHPSVDKGLIIALIIKHIILVSLTIFGIIVHIRYNKKYGK
jgi:hypothetical protein